MFRIPLAPLSWNQGGYDAVHVDFENSIVTFVQITISDKHSLKLEYFSNLLKKLTFPQSGPSQKPSVEIFFLVPKSQRVMFKVSTTSGTLAGYKTSATTEWTCSNAETLVKVVSPADTWERRERST
jgi:hypothetical protein